MLSIPAENNLFHAFQRNDFSGDGLRRQETCIWTTNISTKRGQGPIPPTMSMSHHTPPPTSASKLDLRGHVHPLKHRHSRSAQTHARMHAPRARAHTHWWSHKHGALWYPSRPVNVKMHTHTHSLKGRTGSDTHEHAHLCAFCRPKGVHHGNKRVGQQHAVCGWHRCVSR